MNRSKEMKVVDKELDSEEEAVLLDVKRTQIGEGRQVNSLQLHSITGPACNGQWFNQGQVTFEKRVNSWFNKRWLSIQIHCVPRSVGVLYGFNRERECRFVVAERRSVSEGSLQLLGIIGDQLSQMREWAETQNRSDIRDVYFITILLLVYSPTQLDSRRIDNWNRSSLLQEEEDLSVIITWFSTLHFKRWIKLEGMIIKQVLFISFWIEYFSLQRNRFQWWQV